MQIVHRTTQHVSDFRNFQNGDNNEGKQQLLVELVQMLFEQFKSVAEMHAMLLKCFSRAEKAHNVKLHLYDMNLYWTQVQNVVCSGDIRFCMVFAAWNVDICIYVSILYFSFNCF